MTSSSQLELLRLHRADVRDLLAGFGFTDLRVALRQPTAVLARPGAEVTLHSAYEPGEIARLTEVMENISETFEQLEDLAAR